MDNIEFDSFVNYNEKGFDSVVLQLGSSSIKFGYSSQYTPFIMPNVIAYRIDKKANNYCSSNEILENSTELQKELKLIENNFLEEFGKEERIFIAKTTKGQKNDNTQYSSNINKDKLYKSTIQEKKINSQPPKSTQIFKKALMMSNDINEDIIDNIFKWTDTSNLREKDYLIGREALSIPNEEDFIIRYPIKYGYFNSNYEPSTVLNDLEKILSFCFYDIMKLSNRQTNDKHIEENQFVSQLISNTNLVLIIPDVFIKQQVKLLLNFMFKIFGFKNIIVHTEGVLATFGTAMQIGCVVDIGSTKTSICCVDEGFTIADSIVKRNYGGDDITLLLYGYLTDSEKKDRKFPSNEININLVYHKRIIEKLKEDVVEYPNYDLPTIHIKPKLYKLWLHQYGRDTEAYNLQLNEETILTNLLYYNTNILKSIRNTKPTPINQFNDISNELYTDPEDVMTDLIEGINNEKKEDKDYVSLNEEQSKNKITIKEMFDYIPLDEMICKSILSIHNPELRKKMANSIILTGGGTKTKHFISYLEEKLIQKLTEKDFQIDRVEVINQPSYDNKTLTWIGGSVIPKLETTKELWISREKWFYDSNVGNKKEDEEEKEEINEIDEKADKLEKILDKKQIKRKREKGIDSGLSLLRQKSAFVW